MKEPYRKGKQRIHPGRRWCQGRKWCQAPFPGRPRFLTVFSNPNCATALLTRPSDPYGLLLLTAYRIFSTFPFGCERLMKTYLTSFFPHFEITPSVNPSQRACIRPDGGCRDLCATFKSEKRRHAKERPVRVTR